MECFVSDNAENDGWLHNSNWKRMGMDFDPGDGNGDKAMNEIEESIVQI